MSTSDPAPRNEREIGNPRLESPQSPDEVVGLMSDIGKSAYLALFSQIGITLFVANLGGALLGRWVDGALNSTPIFLVAGFVGGFAVGAVGAAQLIRRALRQFEASDAADRAARLAQRRAESGEEEPR